MENTQRDNQEDARERRWWITTKVINFWHRATALFARTPIVGGLAYCSLANHWAALKEFAILTGFATATFWLSAFIARFSKVNTGVPYSDLVLRSVSQGELFIFSVSILGAIFYTALDEPSWAKRGFPEKAIHISIAGILTLLAATGFSQVKLSSDIDWSFAVDSSLWIAGIAVSLRYLTIVYNKSRAASPNSIRTAETNNFLRRAEAHRQGGHS